MLGERIKKLFAPLDVTSAEFARFIGCDKSYISRMMNGARAPKNGGKGAWRIVDGIYGIAAEKDRLAELCGSIRAKNAGTADEIRQKLMLWLYDGEEAASAKAGNSKERAPHRAFGEKLGALMELTGLSNIRLGRALNVDSSYISRFRGGFRSPRANSGMMYDLCSVILGRAADQGKTAMLAKLIGSAPEELNDKDKAFDILCGWLYNSERSGSLPIVEGLIDNIGSFSAEIKKPPFSFSEAAGEDILSEAGSTYYGRGGLRRAVIRFLGNVIKRGEKELFLYSDQNMEWMVSDPDFRAKWASLMFFCVTGGVRINIIHNFDRGLSEMSDAIKSWLPLYPSGMIRSYYCRARNGNRFSVTMFLCPGYACISGVNAIGTENETGIYRFDTDPEQLKAHEASYRALLDNSGVLLRIYKTREFNSINNRNVKTLAGFGRTLSLATMPDTTFLSALDRGGFDRETREFLISARHERGEQLMRSLKQGFLHEYMPLPTDEDLFDGKVPMDLPTCSLAYTPQEYAEHVRNVIALMEANTNYRVTLIPEAPFDDLDILISNDLAVLGRLKEPYLTIVFEHPDLCRAFAAYAERIREQYKQDKPATKKALERYL